MGGKRRNKNKADRDDLAITASSSRKPTAELDNDSDDSDAESCATHFTLDDDMRSVIADNDDEDDCVGSDSSRILDRLGECLENVSHKNVSIRLASLEGLIVLLTKNCMAEELDKWKTTLMEVVEKCLRKTDEESARAAVIAALISLQLGDAISDEAEGLVLSMRDICMDASRVERLRMKCAQCAALVAYLSLTQPESTALVASGLRSVWMSTKTNALNCNVFSAALSGWSLLVHQADRRPLEAALLDEPKLCSYIEGPQIEMRLSVGEALTVLYEAGISAMGDGYRFPNHQHLLEVFATLSTDSVKFRAKKDRRVQRFSFRQIYNVIKDQTAPTIKIKFGSETLELDSCGRKLLYDMCCGVLHGGMNAHLKSNPLVRDLFDLGPSREEGITKISKLHRMAIQNAVNKTRDVQRSKQRDKRSC